MKNVYELKINRGKTKYPKVFKLLLVRWQGFQISGQHCIEVTYICIAKKKKTFQLFVVDKKLKP